MVNGEQSGFLDVESGVPQGTVLGPALFLVYINDMPESVKSSIRLFADDAILYRQIRNLSDCSKLQKDLESLENWARKWLMSFNATKCEIMRFTRSKNPITPPYVLNNISLKEVQTSKYLGVHPSSDLSLNTHIDATVGKATGKLRFLRRNLKSAPQQTKELAYNA